MKSSPPPSTGTQTANSCCADRGDQPTRRRLCTVQSDAYRGERERAKNWLRRHDLAYGEARNGMCVTLRLLRSWGPPISGSRLWFAGQKFSRNHEAIKVTWDEAGTKLQPRPSLEAWSWRSGALEMKDHHSYLIMAMRVNTRAAVDSWRCLRLWLYSNSHY